MNIEKVFGYKAELTENHSPFGSMKLMPCGYKAELTENHSPFGSMNLRRTDAGGSAEAVAFRK